MLALSIIDKTGAFAENKDIARDIRLNEIIPAVEAGEDQIILDFKGVSGATQSFIHALVSDLIRKYGSDIFKILYFKNCSAGVQQVVNIVADYMEASYE